MMPGDPKIVRWQEWEGAGLEHLILRQQGDEISAESVVICSGEEPFAIRYRIACDAAWHAKSVEIGMIGSGARLSLASDGRGGWTKDGVLAPELDGALDPDLTITPFTNTLPVRRL